jgi:hypothetical protein
MSDKGISCAEEDYLDEDPIISNQLYVCVSIFTPNSIKTPDGEDVEAKHNVRAIKIRGVYPTYEKAEKRCEEIRKFDRLHNVFVGEVGKWLPWDDDAEKAEDAVYAEPKLNEMMKSYKEAQQKAADYKEERKMNAHREAMKKKKEVEQKIKEEQAAEQAAKEKDPENLQNDVITRNIIEANIMESNERQEKVKESSEMLEKEQKEVNTKEETIHKIDDELEKAKKLYESLMKKYNIEKSQNR